MRAEEQFDSFYLKTRRALVHQAFALTGDLPAAQRAVRDTYVAAWHHWRKVSDFEDPRDWVRPRAWLLAQRRHTARLWHRSKGTTAQDKAVLDALHRLTVHERRVLLLSELAGVPHDVAARELSMPQAGFEYQLARASVRFAEILGTTPDAVHPPLATLAGAASVASLPRPAAVRREGRRRRRRHTAVAVAAATFVAVGSGAVAHESPGPPAAGPAADPGAAATTEAGPGATPSPSPSPTGPPLPSADDLLTTRDIAPLSPGTRWREGATHDNTSGEGINVVCQQERFADPDGLAALVRTFRAPGRTQQTLVQVMEVSADDAGARASYDTVASWFAGCQAEEVHLRRTHTVRGVGDRAFLVELDGWRSPEPTYTVAIAQAGQVLTTTVVRTARGTPPTTGRTLRALAGAVRKICASTDRSGCVESPRAVATAPRPSGDEPGILSVVDLPGLAGIDRPWVGTSPAPGRRNPAATTCDRAGFAQAGAVRARTRTFLLPPQVPVPSRFGLTETYGTFPDAAAARAFMSTVRGRFAGCEDRDLATDVTAARSVGSGPLDGSTWRIETELSETSEVVFDVGFVRRGASVAQVTFVPAGRAELPDGAFGQIVLRAGERLREIG